MDLIKPVIHLNGTSPETLAEGYRLAVEATRRAAEAINQIEFNARDYYPHPDRDAWTLALQQMRNRLLHLETVEAELFALYEHCQTELDRREARRQEQLTQIRERSAAE